MKINLRLLPLAALWCALLSPKVQNGKENVGVKAIYSPMWLHTWGGSGTAFLLLRGRNILVPHPPDVPEAAALPQRCSVFISRGKSHFYTSIIILPPIRWVGCLTPVFFFLSVILSEQHHLLSNEWNVCNDWLMIILLSAVISCTCRGIQRLSTLIHRLVWEGVKNDLSPLQIWRDTVYWLWYVIFYLIRK